MSKNEILQELAKLSPEDRQEVRAKLNELDGVVDDGWDDDGELTEEQKRMILARIAQHERNPESAIPWEKAEATLDRLFPK